MGDDIVKDLRFCAPLHSQMGYPENAKLFARAANEIERLREVVRAQSDFLVSDSSTVRTDMVYIRSLEQRVREQRAQLRWWNKVFERRELRHKHDGRWSASDVCALLRRLGSPHRVDAHGVLSRRLRINRPQ